MKIGTLVTDFSAPSTSDTLFKLSSFKEKFNIVLYFYPKDNTPGCTTEGRDFSDHYIHFQEHDTIIVGISRDTIRKHENFKAKQAFPFELISDVDESICNLFEVLKLKKLYGREYIGIERSTFLINKSGILANEWRKVSVDGHVKQVLKATMAL